MVAGRLVGGGYVLKRVGEVELFVGIIVQWIAHLISLDEFYTWVIGFILCLPIYIPTIPNRKRISPNLYL